MKTAEYRLILAALGTSILLCGPASPAMAAGNVQTGKALAEQWCANCHSVSRMGNNALESQPVGPDFSAMKAIDMATLKKRLQSPHPVMSQFPELRDEQIADLAAYIASMRR